MEAKPEPATPDTGGHAEDAIGHVVDLRVLLGVFAALMVLTAVTVAVSYFDFGKLNLLVAMGVATVKAALVALYFMHLKYDRKIYAIIFVGAVLFLALFIIFTMFDTMYRDEPSEVPAMTSEPAATPAEASPADSTTSGLDSAAAPSQPTEGS